MSHPELDLTTLPLHGRCLIEANAGTGKTYSITALYLRLVVEKSVEVDRILVMTFTRAATAELRARLRSVLQQARQVLEGGTVGEGFACAYLDSVDDHELALERVHRALRRFDLAPVLTIHGFCQQVLSRYSLSAGWDPDRELVADEGELLKPLLREAWNELAAEFSAAFAASLSGEAANPDSYLGAIRSQLGKPQRRVLLPENPGDEASLEAACRTLRHELVRLWLRDRRELETLLREGGLNRQTYNDKAIARVIDAMESLSEDPDHAAVDPGVLAYLGRAKLEARLRKNASLPSHELFGRVDEYLDLMERLASLHSRRQATLWWELLERIQPRLESWKRQQGLRSYNDLLQDLHRALSAPDSQALAEAILEDYPVALIDEFQDTDQLQYAIFRRIYDGADGPVIHVGDPKQALYAFRGADVYAYLAAAEEVDSVWSLARNWRSRDEIVEGVNALFAGPGSFLTPGIDYQASRAARPGRPAPLRLDDADRVGLEARLLAPGPTKNAMALLCARAVAAEIAELLEAAAAGRLTIGGEPLRPGQIAVLVRKHEQAGQVARALSEQGLRYVQPGHDSVWASPEAETLVRVLRALLEPHRLDRLAAALATPIVGAGVEEVDALSSREDVADRWMVCFAEAGERWVRYGVASALALLMESCRSSQRILARPGGERCLTNLQHLQDLTCDKEYAAEADPVALLRWYERQLEEQPADEASVSRVDSDADLIQLMTIHKAKGLEFPVVFVPYLWDASSHFEQLRAPECHDDEGQPLLDLGSDRLAVHGERALAENAAEDIRLAYVALTRASRYCVFHWSHQAGCQYSPLRRLLFGNGNDWRSGLAVLQGVEPEAALARVRDELEQRGIGVREADPAEREQRSAPVRRSRGVLARPFPDRAIEAWRVHSYSSIVSRGHGAEPQARDVDPFLPEDRAPEGEVDGIFALPGGARMGTLFHDILETLPSFAPDEATLRDVVARHVRDYGEDEAFVPVIADQLRECLETPLESGTDPLRLARLGTEDCIRELEFHFAVPDLQLERLLQLVCPGTRDFDGPLRRGFLRGFIDLVFRYRGRYWLVDYKSNVLGRELAAYREPELEHAVREARYDLQYHLYGLALHRHLRQLLPEYDPERDLGGVYYLFLRGMRRENGPASGVFHRRISATTLDQMENLLQGGAE